MEKKLPSYKFYSHPDKLLNEHLSDAGSLAELFSTEKSISLFDKDTLRDITKIVAFCHDIGKATDFFQEYLNAPENEKIKLKNRKETHHSLLSAVCSYYLTKKYLITKRIDDWFFPFVAFVVVKRHHGNIEDIKDEVIFTEEDRHLLQKQVASINEEEFRVFLQSFSSIEVSISNLLKWINEFPSESEMIKRKLRKLKGEDGLIPYIKLNFLYSILLDADKSDVGVKTKEVFLRRFPIDKGIVDNYKIQRQWKESTMNNLREEAYKEIINQEIDLKKRIFSINLPTGIGKTLISFSFALKLRKKIEQEEGILYRIIYSLPFLSVIEQNAKIFEEIFATNGVEVNSQILLKHHHLSETLYKWGEDDEFEPEASKILIESWASEIIITTFVQLFHTLISNKNKMIRKFHRLANSIIILDEIQSIPHKYWLLCCEMIKAITTELNSYVVFVTATQPLIFNKKDIFPLMQNKERYFNALDRVVIIPSLRNNLNIEEFVEGVSIKKDKSYLFILNTINSAKKLYEELKKHPDINECEISLLSTYIIPKERLNRIEEIKKKKKRIAVTTQLVEAGVDIDFDVVYRDIAPIDSINQSAGRCNRNNYKKKGIVYIISLKDENGRLFASYIYDPVLLNITKDILKDCEKIEEKEILSLVNEYYEHTVNETSKDKSRELLEAIYKLKYDTEDEEISINDFRLIEKDYDKFDVFIELDDVAKKVWEEYEKTKGISDLFKRRSAFDRIKSSFYQYVISISTNVENTPPEVAGFRYVSKGILKEYYDMETGYISKGTNPLW